VECHRRKRIRKLVYRLAGAKTNKQKSEWSIRQEYSAGELHITVLHTPAFGRRRLFDMRIAGATSYAYRPRTVARAFREAACRELDEQEAVALPPEPQEPVKPAVTAADRALNWMAWLRRLKALPPDERMMAILRRNPQGIHITDIRVIMGGTRARSEVILHRLERSRKVHVYHYVATEARRVELLKRNLVRPSRISVVGYDKKVWRLS
jgi:hypothetical protein